MLANWLKSLLPYVVSESRSAFQSDKAISDNILVAFETLHHMKMKKLGKEGYMAMKLDISKAYDRVEWIFLESLMFKLGFHEKWVGMVMATVKTISYSILVNGEPQGIFNQQKGLGREIPYTPTYFCFAPKDLMDCSKNLWLLVILEVSLYVSMSRKSLIFFLLMIV